jgi:hypothetical protein
MRRPGLGGGQSSASRYDDPARLEKGRLSLDRCLFDGGAGGVTVREEGIMLLRGSAAAKA